MTLHMQQAVYIHYFCIYTFNLSLHLREEVEREVEWSICIYTPITIGRLLQIVGLFCRIQSLLQASFAKETYFLVEWSICIYPLFVYIPSTSASTSSQMYANICLQETQRREVRVKADAIANISLVSTLTSVEGEEKESTVNFSWVRKRSLPSKRRLASAMGWLRLVGSLKLQVSFAKQPYKRDETLQKRPVILRSLLIIATPQPAFPRPSVRQPPFSFFLYNQGPTGLQRPVACLVSQVIFRKRATHHRAPLRKMTYKDQASYGSLPPCMGWL